MVIIEQTQAQGDAKTETAGDRKIDVSLSSQVGFQKLITSPIRGLLRVFGFDEPGTTVAEGTPINFVQARAEKRLYG